MSIAVVCPVDGSRLVESKDSATCEQCGCQYRYKDGVLCTMEGPDDFYEGAYENQVRFLPRSETPWHAWPLWLINSGYLWAVRRHVRPGAIVLELGCAGGVRYFGQRYRMVGCDLSLASLSKIDFYERRIQADAAACIPLPDASVDAVVCSYFWEHIHPSIKPRILRECRRILKPLGKLVFLYDVWTDNPLIGRFRDRNPALYKELFIENDGHLGYQRPSDNIATFQEAGFRVIAHHGMEKTWILSPSTYHKLSQFQSRHHHLLRRLARLGQRPFFYPYTALMRLVDTLIGPCLPAAWARVALVVCVLA